MKTITENGAFQKRSPESNFCFRGTCGRVKTELVENADVILSVPIHSAQYYRRIQEGGQAHHFLVFNTVSATLKNVSTI